MDCRRLGPEIAHLLRSYLLEPATTARIAHPDRVFDVHYRSLVADPTGTVREIYNHFGLEMDEAMERGMQQWLAANPADKHGTHHYDLEQFGLKRTDVERQFGDYQERFAIPGERVPAGVA